MKGNPSPLIPWIQRLRLFADEVGDSIGIIERLLTRLLKAAERILLRIVIFAAFVALIYEIFKHL
jgi:hypothetical protein